MAKVKVKTLIGSVVTVAFFLTVIVAFLFYAFPENVASATGFGPYDGQRILTFCAILVATLFLSIWGVLTFYERLRFKYRCTLIFNMGARSMHRQY